MIQVKKPNGAIAKPMIPMSSTRQSRGGKAWCVNVPGSHSG
jgi:hypothetical protein